MKTSTVWASLALAHAPTVLSQGLRQATGGPAPTLTSTSTAPTASSTCTANLVTTLCDYPSPEPGTAVASSGKANCWEYCNAHPPCDFVIFAAGNPYTGTGTCWLYPGEKFDETKGETGCDYLSVFDKPTCAGDAATPTSGACEATASPSAIAEVCGYPEPDDKCWSTCAASSGAVDCLSQCAEDDCAFAIFYTGEGGGSQYGSGTCWKYPNGTYDASKAGTCAGRTEQYVYENKCPKKEAASSSSASSAPSASASESGKAKETGAAGGDDAKAAEAKQGQNGTGEGSAAAGVTFSGMLAAGVVGLMWWGL
ncbi:uncharacterized protein CC84DRAFT_1158774 [Paraphaeosphaeria sporulosa]|uniref:Apple domain-containing protein n=1 Tax=Paraphaeosphaeria sporulosa TaxID=1460663 RepID=A0A177CVC3_9PLEO|nr:uncharacterized protein CC84DRAFT_1158774 [Paraphaeosphaeria sporulosa]OAG11171.1 hypothetical protein CC84DRAFT_1158774 [Paraphaeosphaeria sporulosa]